MTTAVAVTTVRNGHITDHWQLRGPTGSRVIGTVVADISLAVLDVDDKSDSLPAGLVR